MTDGLNRLIVLHEYVLDIAPQHLNKAFLDGFAFHDDLGEDFDNKFHNFNEQIKKVLIIRLF
ncbi:hypothetical protein MOVS_06685 [Moraxella ovis]|uniref:Uncharacterized protein n=1 Tax=Moraxella ovis TaxID=29433 RepID=A0ABN4PQ61_9GAMM|nr:hypothetical protein MOVS_06685 [Moraxella ovis]